MARISCAGRFSAVRYTREHDFRYNKKDNLLLEKTAYTRAPATRTVFPVCRGQGDYMQNVFILEDSRTDAMRLRKALEHLGYTVVGTAESGAEAIAKAPGLNPDVMFIDIILRERRMDGVEAARALHRIADIPIIFVTSFSDEDIVDRALSVSPYAYMLKPIDQDQLRVTLEAVKNRIRMERHQRALIEQLNQSQKMEAIGRLAGGIAHNFNNILSVMIGNAELCMRDLDEADPNSARVQKIKKSGMRAKDLTAKLLALSREDELRLAPVHATELIEDVCDMLKGCIGKKVQIRTRFHASNPVLSVDFNQVTQALLNVCLNGCDAMEAGGELALETDRVTLDEDAARARPGLSPGEYCRITVRDTGAGIPEAIRDKIFEPFFTTKDKERGTGLGLYVTLGIIKGHHGAIDVADADQGGTAVSIYLPVTRECVAAEPAACGNGRNAGRNRTVLIVDDEQDFLDMTSETLTREGYRVMAAATGARAIEMYRSHGHEIDLVLLDIIMPELDGGDVFHAIRDMAHDAKVVLCSGYSAEGKVSELMQAGVNAFIQKPFVYTDLDRVITSVLEA